MSNKEFPFYSKLSVVGATDKLAKQGLQQLSFSTSYSPFHWTITYTGKFYRGDVPSVVLNNFADLRLSQTSEHDIGCG